MLKKFIKDGVAQLAIARPEESKSELVYKHPDNTIPMQARLTVDADDIALFFRDGEFVHQFPAGLYVLESDTLPFLGQLVNRLTDGNVFRAQVFFVTLRHQTGMKFGGRIGKMRDPESGLATELMVHGSFSLRVAEPQSLLLGLSGMGKFESEGFDCWFREQVLKVIRDVLAEYVVKEQWPLLHITSGAYTREVETIVLEAVQEYVQDYGIEVPRLGNFHVAINKEDEKRLEDFYEKAAYIRMAGGLEGYDQLAQADMKRGAAKGLAKGGGQGGSSLLDGAGLGLGFQLGNQLTNNSGQASQGGVQLPGDRNSAVATQTSPALTVECGACGANVAPGKFCSECGTPLAEKKKFCSECGSAVSGKFCSECGTPA